MDKEFSDFISTVLEKTDIVSLISRYVKLERRGNTFWACCPFHHETKPSFAVNADRQFFHCFGCKESGNALSFVMKVENVEFIDALKILAEAAGLEVPKPSGTFVRRVDRKEREALYALMRDAARHYHDNLSSPRARRFNEYLDNRRIAPAMIRRFGLGVSVDYSEMIGFLQSKGYTFEQMHAAGIAEKKDGRVYDVFGERIIYPIIDNMGHVVAFGGRTIEKDDHIAKYRNSTQTDIFDKSNVIYGINLLKKRKAQAPIDYVIMTEGYMDVISLHKAGFDTAVASMGTSLTVKQARQLKLYSNLVYISYDGDSAGQKATLRGLDILRETGLIVKVVRLPDGLDPDDVIKRDGAEGYKKLLDEAIPLTAYKIEVLKNKYDLDDPDTKAIFAIEAAKLVAALDNPIEQEQYMRYVSDLTGFTVEALKRQTDFALNHAPSEPKPRRDGVSDKPIEYDQKLIRYLSCLLWGYDYVTYERDLSGAMPDDFSRRLYAFCKEHKADALKLYESEFMGDDIPKINEILNYKYEGSDEKGAFFDSERDLYREALENEQKYYRERLNTKFDLDDLQHIKDLAHEIQAMGEHHEG